MRTNRRPSLKFYEKRDILFNAKSRKSLDLAIEVVKLSAQKSSPYDRRMRRWVANQKSHFAQVWELQALRDAVPRFPGNQ